MRKGMFLIALLMAALPLAGADLQVYFIDVEGGQATLIVSPAGQSMLVDAGWPSKDGPGADRVVMAAQAAGIKKIDYLLVTHYHLDHVGGVPEVAAKIPVGTFIDHGPNNETDPGAQALSAAYEKTIARARHLVVKPGDRIPLKGVDIAVVSANGETIKEPLKGAGEANAACAAVKPKENDPSENARSIGFILSYGRFRMVDLADLTWNKENALVCPNNLLGTVDLYMVTHHGMDISNSPAIVEALHPRVAVMNNGAHKGGSPRAWWVVSHSPGLEDLWQLHASAEAGPKHSADEARIANPEMSGCQGHWIKLTARNDGTFTVLNSRNGASKTYRVK